MYKHLITLVLQQEDIQFIYETEEWDTSKVYCKIRDFFNPAVRIKVELITM